MEVIQSLSARLETRVAEAADLRARLELTAKAESTLQAERDRLLADVRREREEKGRERERADLLEQQRQQAQEEAQRLRTELEAELSKGFWKRLFGG